MSGHSCSHASAQCKVFTKSRTEKSEAGLDTRPFDAEGILSDELAGVLGKLEGLAIEHFQPGGIQSQRPADRIFQQIFHLIGMAAKSVTVAQTIGCIDDARCL